MPRLYRTMKSEGAHPAVGPSARTLGVREHPPKHADVDVDHATKQVALNGRGMSVAAHWTKLPHSRIPARLDDGSMGYMGKDNDRCWVMGEGSFVPGPLNEELALALKSHNPELGNVVPALPTTISDFQAALAATRTLWSVDES